MASCPWHSDRVGQAIRHNYREAGSDMVELQGNSLFHITFVTRGLNNIGVTKRERKTRRAEKQRKLDGHYSDIWYMRLSCLSDGTAC